MTGTVSNYRPDIDGLRAVAVLSVLLFHANPDWLTGGYVGVDIFFVISGYLITTIISKEISQGSFTVVGFYERRFRRLLPALFIVVLFCGFIGLILLHPRDLIDLAQSIFATSLFSSNILFNFESGYFDGPAEFKPLLHTWSLAVEEQYYLLFPIFLVLVNKYSKLSFRMWIFFLFILSFLICVTGTLLNPTAAFYLLPSRAWELLAGSLIAVRALPFMKNRILREVLALLGVFCIYFSLIFFTPNTFFPGYTAALPVIGTILLLYSGENQTYKTIVARVLSNRLLVGIGLISYSLYLWHWPVLVYANYATTSEINAPQLGLAMVSIFTLAVLSWKYIETPLRKKYIIASTRHMLVASGLASLMMAAIGVTLISMNGLPTRYAFASSEYTNDSVEWDRWGACQDDMETRLSYGGGLCGVGVGVGDPMFLFWGDSHARALAPAIELSAIQQSKEGVIATKTACPPLLGIDRAGQTSCAKFNDMLLKYLKSNNSIQTVILAGRWNLVFTGEPYKEESGDSVELVNVQAGDNVEHGNAWYLDLGLRRTVRSIIGLGKSVVVVNQIPEIGYDVRRIDFISHIFSSSLDERIAPSLDEYRSRSQGIHSILKDISTEYSLDVIEPENYLCTHEMCHVSLSGITLYLDDDHLSTAGARYIANMFNATLSDLK